MLVASIVAYGVGFYVLRANVKEASALTQQLNQEESAHGGVTSLKYLLNETESDRKTLDTFFVDSSEVVDFIQRVESLGKDTHATVSIKDLREQPEGLVFSIDVSGSFAGVMHLVTLIEHLPYNLSFQQVSLDRVVEEKGAVSWHGTITATLASFVK